MSDYEVASMMAVGFTTFLVFVLILIVPYILGAIGLYTMAKRQEVGNEWLAFIPFGNTYIMGQLIEPKLKWMPIDTSGGLKLLIIYGASFIISFIPILGTLVSFAVAIFGIVILHWLYEKYTESAVMMTIITIITAGLAAFIIVFALRKKEVRY